MASTVRKPRFRFPTNTERRADLLAGLVILVLTLVSEWGLLTGGTTVGTDAVTQFYTWYSYLGESLRSGNVPVWNPSQFSGAPFTGDPLSGWTYLPAMILFTLLPLVAAVKTYLFAHVLLAGLFTYALARTLKMGPAGALLAAAIYEFNGHMFIHNICCFAWPSVLTWLPLAILGVELAIRSTRWLQRGLWWGVSGLAVSQILASWLGQGTYYALLALGGYVLYRTLISPPDTILSIWGRVSGLFLHGTLILVFGFGLAAAGLLPRLEYKNLSSLANGYSKAGLEGDNSQAVASLIGGWSASDLQQLFVSPGFNYVGAAVLTLGLTAPLIARGRYAVPYFAALMVFALTLAGSGLTPLHSLLYKLPDFEQIHPHFPNRVMLVFYLGAALLAGATLTDLGKYGRKTPSLIALPILAALFLLTRSAPAPDGDTLKSITGKGLWEGSLPFLVHYNVPVLAGPFFTVILALVFAAAYALLPSRFAILRGLVVLLLVLTVFFDLFSADLVTIDAHADFEGGDKIVKVDLGRYYDPTGAVKFLKSKGKDPSRYLSYNPEGRYVGGFTSPNFRALQAENRATAMGLQSVQGYNPVHLARYDDYIEALNGRSQKNYHGTNVYASGLGTPLLNLLNVRYIAVPATFATLSDKGKAILKDLEQEHPTVYKDSQVRVLENRDAMPRAWIVHSARRTKPKDALEMLQSGKIDPKKTALIKNAPPALSNPDDTSADQASVTGYKADRIELNVSTKAPGMLMLSEVYYPAWKAYVDGKPVSTYRADYLLRAVSVPAGKHTVEFRYESKRLRIGIVVSLITCAALISLAVAATIQRRRQKQEPEGQDAEATSS